MKKTHTSAILVFSIIATIASILLFIFFLRVIDNKNKHINAVLSTLGEKLREKENAIIFTGKVAEIKTLQDSINSHFVNPDQIDTFVSYLEKVGADLGSQVSVESIEVPEKNKNIIAVRLSVKGTFEKVTKTVTYLENIPYQISITQIYLNENVKDVTQYNPSAKDQIKSSNTPMWQADVSFNVLSLK